MKCPYRTVKKIRRDHTYGTSTTEIDQSFPECYEEDCPLYVDGECMRVREEIGDYYE